MHTSTQARCWLLAIGLVGGVLTACVAPVGVTPPAGGAAPEFEVTAQKAEDQVTVAMDDGRMIVDVRSPSGIGSAVVSLVAGEMPQPTIMRLHLNGLEQMTFAYDDTVLTLSVSSHDDRQVLRSATVADQPIDVHPQGPYWMDLTHVAPTDGAAGGYFEITAPAAFHDAGPTMFLIAWIDFFR